MANPNTYPSDGRLTSLQNYAMTLQGSELMMLVSPGNASLGINYNVTTLQLAAYFATGALSVVNLIAGATLASPYNVPTLTNVVLFNKSPGSASYAILPLAATMNTLAPVLFKDRNGDAFTNNIALSFTGGEQCDGLSSIVINNDYGWARIAPYPGGNGWYQC